MSVKGEEAEVVRQWADRMLPSAKQNRDDLQRGYETVFGLYMKAEAVRDKHDIVEVCKAMLHWIYIFRDINNLELAILKSIDDQVLARTLQKAHSSTIFAFLEKWPGTLDSKELAAVRRRFPALADMNSETKLAFETFNFKWQSSLRQIRQTANGHYEDAVAMDAIWRELSLSGFFDLVHDFRDLERPFIRYVGETMGKVAVIVTRLYGNKRK